MEKDKLCASSQQPRINDLAPSTPILSGKLRDAGRASFNLQLWKSPFMRIGKARAPAATSRHGGAAELRGDYAFPKRRQV
jgi:hypothetical protein